MHACTEHLKNDGFDLNFIGLWGYLRLLYPEPSSSFSNHACLTLSYTCLSFKSILVAPIFLFPWPGLKKSMLPNHYILFNPSLFFLPFLSLLYSLSMQSPFLMLGCFRSLRFKLGKLKGKKSPSGKRTKEKKTLSRQSWWLLTLIYSSSSLIPIGDSLSLLQWKCRLVLIFVIYLFWVSFLSRRCAYCATDSQCTDHSHPVVLDPTGARGVGLATTGLAATVAAGKEGDDDAAEWDDARDDGLEDGANARDDGHDGRANGTEGVSNLEGGEREVSSCSQGYCPGCYVDGERGESGWLSGGVVWRGELVKPLTQEITAPILVDVCGCVWKM